MTSPADPNQPPEFGPRDLWADDLPLREAVLRNGGEGFTPHLSGYGRLAGGDLLALSADAHRDRPRLRTHNRFGQRIDRVEFHPAYHAILSQAVANGVAGLSWQQRGAPGAHVARAALSYLHYQAEPGSSCPLTMTHAAVPVLQREAALRDWADKAAAPHYDGADMPASDKRGVTVGMGMTERQGGSDVRANATTATPVEASGAYALRGHKWFFSAPMSDAFLVTAQAPGGLGCFLMPRWRPDGSRNAFRLLRLKDKLGDWSNASSEVEFDDALCWRVGGEGRGIATIVEMVMLTRLDCMLGSAALMRMALAQALHHARHRRAFGRPLIEQPLMRGVLAGIALEVEAATAFAFRVAAAVDRAPHDASEAAFARIATAIGKFRICARAPAVVAEALECLGGNGYVEESLMPRLYRQAPLNSIWEGSGNIQCLDVMRALVREPAACAALLRQLDAAAGRNAAYDQALDPLRGALSHAARVPEAGARGWVATLADLLAAGQLLRAEHPAAAAYCAWRLGAGASSACVGTMADAPADALLARARCG